MNARPAARYPQQPKLGSSAYKISRPQVTQPIEKKGWNGTVRKLLPTARPARTHASSFSVGWTGTSRSCPWRTLGHPASVAVFSCTMLRGLKRWSRPSRPQVPTPEPLVLEAPPPFDPDETALFSDDLFEDAPLGDAPEAEPSRYPVVGVPSPPIAAHPAKPEVQPRNDALSAPSTPTAPRKVTWWHKVKFWFFGRKIRGR